MSDDLVTFNVRCEKSQFELKINAPKDLFGLVEKLKNELKLEDSVELVILCPTPEGKMMEISTNDDIEFLLKTKLCYNAVSKEIYCNVELVVIIIHKQLPLDDPRIQILSLSNKVNQLSSQFVGLSESIDNKIEKNSVNLIQEIKSILSEYLRKDSGNKKNSDTSDLKSKINVSPKKSKDEKKKLLNSYTSKVDNNASNMSENLNQSNVSNTNNIDILLARLVQDGFTNTIQNIIVLKRFDNDYEKAVNYLKSSY